MQFPDSSKNWLSITGVAVAIFSLLNIILFFLVSLIFKENNPYIGIILYLIFPGILIFGLILIPVGMSISKKTHSVSKEWPAVDLNNIKHRNPSSQPK